MKRNIVYIILGTMFSCFSCSLIKERDSYLLIPEEVGKQGGIKKYPLIIYLHGSGRAGINDFLKNIGIHEPESLKDPTMDHNFKREEDCYLWIPEIRGDWDTRLLIKRITKIKKKYPIDHSRIYVIGYSMGGAASYRLANDLFDKNKQLFAAIIRLSGQSETLLNTEVAHNTAVWLHIGLEDLPVRVNVTREAFLNLKRQNPDAILSVNDVPIKDVSGKTYSLIHDESERMKLTEYSQVGHGIAGLPFQDPKLIRWLFKQKVPQR